MKQTVIIIIPAFNEAKHIGRIIRTIPPEIKIGRKSFLLKTVVIDDGSTDRTASNARQAGAVVLRHVINAGAGAATRTGLRYAGRQPHIAYVVTIDGDGQHANNDIFKLLRYATAHASQLVVGNRLHHVNHIPWQRRVINWGGTLFSRLLFGIKSRDTQSGLRLYAADIIPHISHYTLDRYGFCTESLWHATRRCIQVDEIPITVRYSKETLQKGQSIWASFEILRDLIRVRLAG